MLPTYPQTNNNVIVTYCPQTEAPQAISIVGRQVVALCGPVKSLGTFQMSIKAARGHRRPRDVDIRRS